MTAIGSSILCGILALFTVITANNDNKEGKTKSLKITIKYIFLCSGIMIFLITPIMLIFQKPNAYQKIIKNKEYTLTKNNKILTITSKNEFLPSADLEIIYDDDKTIQVKLDDKLYTIDKTSEKINEK
jgi:hypothetical protein